jgi:hypothetical protein
MPIAKGSSNSKVTAKKATKSKSKHTKKVKPTVKRPNPTKPSKKATGGKGGRANERKGNTSKRPTAPSKGKALKNKRSKAVKVKPTAAKKKPVTPRSTASRLKASSGATLSASNSLADAVDFYILNFSVDPGGSRFDFCFSCRTWGEVIELALRFMNTASEDFLYHMTSYGQRVNVFMFDRAGKLLKTVDVAPFITIIVQKDCETRLPKKNLWFSFLKSDHLPPIVRDDEGAIVPYYEEDGYAGIDLDGSLIELHRDTISCSLDEPGLLKASFGPTTKQTEEAIRKRVSSHPANTNLTIKTGKPWMKESTFKFGWVTDIENADEVELKEFFANAS